MLREAKRKSDIKKLSRFMLSKDKVGKERGKSIQEETSRQSQEFAEKVSHLKSVKFDEEALQQAKLISK